MRLEIPILLLVATGANSLAEQPIPACISESRIILMRKTVEDANLESARMLRQHIEVSNKLAEAIKARTNCEVDRFWCRSEANAVKGLELEYQLSGQKLNAQQEQVKTLLLQYQLARPLVCAPAIEK